MRRTLLLVSLVSSFLAACSSTPTAPAASAQPSGGTPATATAPAPQPATAGATTGSQTLAHLDPNSALSRERSVYYAFDSAVVTPQYTPVIERHGQYLTGHQALKVVVQGNTDERGSAEYNLALGQQRAQAVCSALRLYGVKDTQLEAVSFGREKPKAAGHDEASWAENRRADIVYR